ncbi:MAG: ankyrin repeat domain-containing protein [Alphaproteobacteria bacterium]
MTINQDKEKNFFSALQKGDNEAVYNFLKEGMDVNIFNALGETPLHIACLYGHVEIVKILLQFNANPKAASMGNGHQQPIHYAAENGNSEILQLLLSKKVNINAKDVSGSTALHISAELGHTEFVETLLKNNARIEVSNNAKQTPLSKAVRSQRVDTVKMLIARGADKDVIDEDGNTVLHNAAYSRNIQIIKIIVDSKTNLNVKNFKGQAPLDIAIWHHKNASSKSYEFCKFLIKSGAKLTEGNIEFLEEKDSEFLNELIILSKETKPNYMKRLQNTISKIISNGPRTNDSFKSETSSKDVIRAKM